MLSLGEVGSGLKCGGNPFVGVGGGHFFGGLILEGQDFDAGGDSDIQDAHQFGEDDFVGIAESAGGNDVGLCGAEADFKVKHVGFGDLSGFKSLLGVDELFIAELFVRGGDADFFMTELNLVIGCVDGLDEEAFGVGEGHGGG